MKSKIEKFAVVFASALLLAGCASASSAPTETPAETEAAADKDFPIHVTGGPTAFFEYGGVTVLTDPTFDPPGDYPQQRTSKTEGPAVAAADLPPIDLVLLSHDTHIDHLDNAGRALLVDVPQILTTPAGAGRLGGVAVGLDDWQTVEIERPDGGVIEVTGVPAIHGQRDREQVEPYAGEVVGFVLRGEGLPTVYISGDNAHLDAVEEIADKIGEIDTAIIYAGAGRFKEIDGGALVVLDSAQAAEAAEILDARRVVPIHFDNWAHFTEGRDDLQAAFEKAGLDDRLDWGIRG